MEEIETFLDALLNHSYMISDLCDYSNFFDTKYNSCYG